jgi:predicted ArsR family transcriptional regulator
LSRSQFDRDIERVALLEDPIRRLLYGYIARQGGYVGREEAASAAGIARGLAAFHLDKLVGAGLLEVTYRRPAGRSGPGAGRPAKLYRRSRQQVSISLPPRDYELLARLLAGAIHQEAPADVEHRLAAAARRVGSALAAEARRLAGRRPSRGRLLQAGVEVLWRQGFEPRSHDGQVLLGNCPFRTVALEHRNLVCPMNLALLEGFVSGLTVSGVTARCESREDGCCVTLRTGPPAGSPPARTFPHATRG